MNRKTRTGRSAHVVLFEGLESRQLLSVSAAHAHVVVTQVPPIVQTPPTVTLPIITTPVTSHSANPPVVATTSLASSHGHGSAGCMNFSGVTGYNSGTFNILNSPTTFTDTGGVILTGGSISGWATVGSLTVCAAGNSLDTNGGLSVGTLSIVGSSYAIISNPPNTLVLTSPGTIQPIAVTGVNTFTGANTVTGSSTVVVSSLTNTEGGGIFLANLTSPLPT